MSVILFILKLIGFLLLFAFGLLLLCAVLLFLVPVRYQVTGVLEETTAIQLKLTWLLHFLTFTADYRDGEQTTAFRVLGLCRKKKQAAEEAYMKDEDAADGQRTKEEAQAPASGTSEEKTQISANDTDGEETQNSAKDAGKRKTYYKQKRVSTRIQVFLRKLRRLRHTLPQTFKQMFGKANRSAVRAFLEEVRYLLRHFKFRRLFTDLRFSMGEPAFTGQVLGVLCMLPMLYQYQVSIVPDFEAEEFYVKGTFEIKGHMRAVHVLVILLHLYQKKETRIFIKNLLDGKDGQRYGRQ